MNRCQVGLTRKAVEQYGGALLVFVVAANDKKTPQCDNTIKKQVKGLFLLGDFKGKIDETILLYADQSRPQNAFSCKRILLVGTGEFKKDDNPDQLSERFRKIGGNISLLTKKIKAEELLLVLPSFLNDPGSRLAGNLVEGMLLGNYRFDKYKKKDKKPNNEIYSGLKNIKILGKGGSLRNSVKSAVIRSEAAITARDMANEPGNNWKPEHFSNFGLSLGKKTNLRCKILGKSQLKKMGMGGIIAVNQGSSVDPQMVILDHRSQNYRKTILLVGKGITFDSGGVSLKPAAGLEDIKYDMCGGAAVISAMQGISQEKPKVRVVAIVPATENMSGSSALKPGDVITHYNGVTSEIVNTDAEGRLILGDALAYGIK